MVFHNADADFIHFGHGGILDATFSKGDIVGCGVTKSKHLFVTKNGVKHGSRPTPSIPLLQTNLDLRSLVTKFGGVQGQLFPVVNICHGGHVRANFGPKFLYDIYSDPEICGGDISGSSNGKSAATCVGESSI